MPALLRADRVRELMDEIHDFLLREEARAVLGVGRKVMEQLEAGGLVNRVPEASRIMESRPYRRSDLVAFVAACVGKAPHITKVGLESERLTKLTSASASGRTVVDVCHALVDRRIRSVATVPEASGLMRLRLRLSDVERVLPAQLETMSMVDAAESLGTAYGNLHVWAKRGFLAAAPSGRRGESGLRLTREAFDEFKRDYVTGGELTKLFGQPRNMWLSRHLKFQGVLPVSGTGIDDAKLTLFRRKDCTRKVIEAVRLLQARPQGSAPDKHRNSFARARLAGSAVATRWGADFERVNNHFTDRKTGRVLQVVSGRRPDLTGVFRFILANSSLDRLRASADSWVALVPSLGDTFLLVPTDQVRWRGERLVDAYVTLRFDRNGKPQEMTDRAMRLPPERTGNKA